MPYDIQGKPGPQVAGDGNLSYVRQTRDGAVVVSDLHGKYYEQSSRNALFVATTASAGIAPGTALTASPALAVVNPASSGRNIAILRARFGYVSGTFAAGAVWWTQGANPATLPAETSAALRASGFLNGSNSGDVAKAYSGVSLTTTPTIVRPSAFDLGTYAGTSATLLPPQFEEIDSEFTVPPGFFVALEGIGGAGTSPICVLSITYEIVLP